MLYNKLLIFYVILVFLAGSALSAKEEIDTKLQEKLEDCIEGFKGDVGVYVYNLETRQCANIRSDEQFPTASMIKVPILLTIFDKIDKGQLSYHQKLQYDESRLYEGEDILGSFKSGEEISLSKLVMLMITMSDNTASLWLQELAGTGSEINQFMEDQGFPGTQVNSRTKGRKLYYQEFGWGQTTPREMAQLFIKIRNEEMISESASAEMYRVLCNIYWNSEALSQIPPYIQAASKQGAVNQSRSETVLVNAPSGDYVFCVITKNQQDTSWDYDNEGYVLIRKISGLFWEYFEPDYDWQPSNTQLWVK